jgi:hypothetical protein
VQSDLPTRRTVVGDSRALQDVCTPLGPRLGLLQVRSPDQWNRLARILRLTRPCPDFGRGTLVGIVSWAGAPLDGAWPVRLDSVQVADGGGLVNATFSTGSYLPDGTAYAETAFVQDLQAVLVVNVNGTTFYPE